MASKNLNTANFRGKHSFCNYNNPDFSSFYFYFCPCLKIVLIPMCKFSIIPLISNN